MPKKPEEPQFDIEAAYLTLPNGWRGCGWIEIGDQDWQGFVVRVLDEGGMIYEERAEL